MIEYRIGEDCNFNVEGSVPDIAREATVLFALIHGKMRELNPEIAAQFKDAVIHVIGNPNNPMWSLKVPETIECSLFVIPEGGAKA